MAKSEGARVRASGVRHTTTPVIWGVENDRQPQLGHHHQPLKLQQYVRLLRQQHCLLLQQPGQHILQ